MLSKLRVIMRNWILQKIDSFCDDAHLILGYGVGMPEGTPYKSFFDDK